MSPQTDSTEIETELVDSLSAIDLDDESDELLAKQTHLAHKAEMRMHAFAERQ